jgi:hypothetical protein
MWGENGYSKEYGYGNVDNHPYILAEANWRYRVEYYSNYQESQNPIATFVFRGNVRPPAGR